MHVARSIHPPNDRRRQQFNKINALMDVYTLHKSLMPPFIVATANDVDAKRTQHTRPRLHAKSQEQKIITEFGRIKYNITI